MRGPTARLRRGGIEIKRGARHDPGAPFRFRHAGLVPASKSPRTLAPWEGWMPEQVRHAGRNGKCVFHFNNLNTTPTKTIRTASCRDNVFQNDSINVVAVS